MGRKSTGSIEARKASIRLKFTWQGVRRTETLDLAPTPGNLKSAQLLLDTITTEIRSGTFLYARHFPESDAGKGPTPYSTFEAYADQWLKTLTVEHGTKSKYTSAMKGVWKPALGAKALADILPSDIRAVVATRFETVSGKTINNELIPLRSALQSAMDDRLIPSNPASAIKNLKHQRPLPDPFTPEEMEAILADLKARAPTEVWAYYQFAFCTGLRPSEQIIVRWGKVDWGAPSVRIDTARTYSQEKGTKTSTIRDVDLTPRALEALTAMKAVTFMKGLDHPIFANPATGDPWATDEYQRTTWFQPALKRLGIRHRGAVQTRHTYATTALMGGVNPAYISRQMGHKNSAMLFQTYSRWIDRADRGREADKLAALHSGTIPGTIKRQTAPDSATS